MASLVRNLPAGVQTLKAPAVRDYPEAATQSFKAGDLVNLNGSGQVQLAKAAGNNLGASDKVLGMALEDASGSGSTNAVGVMIFDESVELTLPVYHATPASAVTAEAGNGVAYELRHHTGSIWCVDIGSTSNTKVTQTSVCDKYPAGETNGLITVRFLKAALTLG